MNFLSADHLSRVKIKISDVIDEELRSLAPTDISILDDTALRSLAKRIHQSRRKRNKFIPVELMGEPAWDILLDLFAASTYVSVKHIALTSNIPATTVLRWLSLLESYEFLSKEIDACDARRANISLTDYGREMVASALRSMRLEELMMHNR